MFIWFALLVGYMYCKREDYCSIHSIAKTTRFCDKIS